MGWVIIIFIFAIILIIPVFLSILLLAALWRHRTNTRDDIGNLLIMGIVCGSGFSCMSYSLELLTPDLSWKFFLVIARYLGNILFILSSFYYCVWYTDLWQKITRLIHGIIIVPVVLCLLTLITNPIHHLYYTQVSLVSFEGFPQFFHTNGPFYYLLQGCALFILFATVALFIKWRTSSPRGYNPVVIVLLIGFCCPILGYLFYLSGVRPFGFLNLTSFFMFGTSVCMTLAIFQYNALSLRPIAYRRVIDNFPAGIILLDPNLRIVEMNPAAELLLAIQSEQGEVPRIMDLFDPGDPICELCTQQTSEIREMTRSGKFLSLMLSPLFGPGNTRIGSLLLILDKTNEKNAEIELKRSATLMNEVFNAIHDGILVIGMDNSIITCNEEFWNLCGIPSSIRGSTNDQAVLDYISARVCFPVMGNFLNEHQNHESCEAEQIITLEGGRILEMYSALLKFDEKPFGRIFSFHDLTDLKTREKALLESEARYKLIVENAADLIWTLTPQGIFTYVSPSWNRITGYPVEETIGKDFRNFVHPDDIDHCERFINQAMKSKGKIADAEYRVLHADGSWHYHAAASAPVSDDDGHFTSLVGISRDITDKKFVEHTLRRANQQLNLLTSITRHDILNLIMAAQAYLDLMNDSSSLEDMGKSLNTIRTIIESIQSQIEFTRVYENLGSQDPRWHPIEALLLSIERPDNIKLDISPLNVIIYADPMLKKVFENLIDNSVRHGGRVTHISISGESHSDSYTLWYRDNGIGVEPSEKNMIFMRGFGKNTGMGLFLVREILGITGISIDEVGEYEKGAVFEITVPHGRYRT